MKVGLLSVAGGIAAALAATALPGEAFLRSLPPDPGRGKRAPKPTTAPPDGPPDETWSRQRRRAWERKNGGPR